MTDLFILFPWHLQKYFIGISTWGMSGIIQYHFAKGLPLLNFVKRICPFVLWDDSSLFPTWLFIEMLLWNEKYNLQESYLISYLFNGLVVKALDSQSMCPVVKTTGWLQGRLSLSSFWGLDKMSTRKFLGTEW